MKPQPWHLLIVSIALAFFGDGVRADALKISQLEQDVRELKRQTDQQARRIDNLESEIERSRATLAPGPERSGARAAVTQPTWLQIANWDRLKPGMTELEAIQLLGPPSTLRKAAAGDTQTLLYALEIGVGSFLVGSVTLIDKRVSEVIKPALQ